MITTIIMIIVMAMIMTLTMIVTFGEGPGTELSDNDYSELGVTHGAACLEGEEQSGCASCHGNFLKSCTTRCNQHGISDLKL
jgi:hypothetical protein